MPELTREEKLKIFEKLSKELQNLMQSEDTGAFLLRLGDKYNLEDNKISSLAKIVGDIVLGITPITSLAQEINSKIISDPQASMHMAQELYLELLSPVMEEAKPIPTPQPSQISPRETLEGKPPAAPITKPQIPDTKYQIPPTDPYREPISGAPEIIDLRKTPPPPMQVPITAAPAYIPPPAVPIPLIEANPHKMQEEKIAATPSPSQISPRETLEGKPQFIIRPPGLAPTDAPLNILDLRKDKGEF